MANQSREQPKQGFFERTLYLTRNILGAIGALGLIGVGIAPHNELANKMLVGGAAGAIATEGLRQVIKGRQGDKPKPAHAT